MPRISINVTLELGQSYQVVIKLAGETLHFEESGTQQIENVNQQTYIMLIAGFQDPNNLNSTVNVKVKQGSKVLSNTTIDDRKFIKYIPVEVE